MRYYQVGGSEFFGPSDYFGRTNTILNSGNVPKCPVHQTPMAAADDHGRFVCFECESPPVSSALEAWLDQPASLEEVQLMMEMMKETGSATKGSKGNQTGSEL